MVFEISLIFLLSVLLFFTFYGKTWSNSLTNFLFANRSLQIISSGFAISSHWFWAIAMFLAPAVAYNWGIIGLLWFVIPNAASLLMVALLTHRLRNSYPNGYSLTQYIKDNFSRRVSIVYQVVLTLTAFAGVLLGFTAITKFFAFAGLDTVIEPIYASLIIGLITLVFTMRGGIRTGIYTGALQSIIWLIFIGGMLGTLLLGDSPVYSLGKNELTTIFNEKFLTTFAITYLFSIFVGPVSHGAMWQKSFSMPKENIFPSFFIGFLTFAFIVFGLGSIGLYASTNGITISSPETAALTTILTIFGPIAITLFGVLLIGQTSTVMDAMMTYISSVASREWFHIETTLFARTSMFAFMLLAWIISWFKIEIWSIFMAISVLRISMFAPLTVQIYQARLKESIIYYGSFITIIGSFYLAYTARILKAPIYDMYFVLYAVGCSLLVCILSMLVKVYRTLDNT